MTDQFGREILTEPLKGGGMRYIAADGSICTALKSADPAAALAVFNANPPPRLQAASMPDQPEGDDLITKIEALSVEQQKRLKRALLKIQS